MSNTEHLLSKINVQYQSFSKGQKKLAAYIKENYDKAAFLTAAKLGKTAVSYTHLKIRKMLEIMEKDWKEYILSSAEKSIYQRGAFWEYLDKGERENAQILLGLLEEIRNCHTSRAEKSWIAFAYLFHKSIGVEYSFLEGEKLVSFEKICSVAEKYQEIPFLPSAYICAAFFWAESQNIEIQRNGTYDFLYPCLKRCV